MISIQVFVESDADSAQLRRYEAGDASLQQPCTQQIDATATVVLLTTDVTHGKQDQQAGPRFWSGALVAERVLS